jgi:hypothetical protein
MILKRISIYGLDSAGSGRVEYTVNMLADLRFLLKSLSFLSRT